MLIDTVIEIPDKDNECDKCAFYLATGRWGYCVLWDREIINETKCVDCMNTSVKLEREMAEKERNRT